MNRFILSVLALWSALAFGQSYPSKPVRVIVPFPPGGTTDVVARLVVVRAGERLGQPVVVDNVAGASGQIGTSAGIRAAGDGYVLTLGNNQTHAANAALFPDAGVDLAKDVTPLARLVRSRHAIVVPAASPYRSLRELIDGGRARPLNYASSSPGSSSQLVSETLRIQNGMQLTHVPYKGAAPAVLAVMAGQVDFMTASLGSVAQHIAGGKLRALAVSGERRDPAMGGVPTLAELGHDALSADVWIALFAPAGAPPVVSRRWSDALGDVMRLEDTRDKLAAAGFEPWFLAAPEAARFHREEVPRWVKMVRDAGLRVD